MKIIYYYYKTFELILNNEKRYLNLIKLFPTENQNFNNFINYTFVYFIF